MTDIQINHQIKTIEKATEKALKSKETALKFLSDAGIIRKKRKEKKAKKKIEDA